jgi:hypothetical protein
MTDEEKRFERREEARLDDMYDAGTTDEGQRTRLTFDAEVREMIKEAVEMEREACAQICDEQMEWGEINKSMAVAAGNCADLIRERGQ